jgi:THO complex subunit 4
MLIFVEYPASCSKRSRTTTKKQSLAGLKSSLPSHRERSLREHPFDTISSSHPTTTQTDASGVLKDLFGQIGKVRKAFIHLGPSGKSTGVADVIFDNNRDADKALTSYNNIELDRT